MSVLSDREIKKLCEERGMITPFFSHQVKEVAAKYKNKDIVKKVISFGLSSYGYDIRCANVFRVFSNLRSSIVDPKEFKMNNFETIISDNGCIIPPNSFALTVSLERFNIPRDVLTLCVGKSTYARCGIVVNVTPFEPEWEGHATLEISNTTPIPAKIYANEGIAQVVFLQGNNDCAVSYKDRQGKYQSQEGIVLPRM